jgi:hypothetical protein
MRKRRQHGGLRDVSQPNNGITNFLFHDIPAVSPKESFVPASRFARTRLYHVFQRFRTAGCDWRQARHRRCRTVVEKLLSAPKTPNG